MNPATRILIVDDSGSVRTVLRKFLADLGCRKIRLMSNSERRIVGIEGFGIQIVGRIPIPNASERKPRLRPIRRIRLPIT